MRVQDVYVSGDRVCARMPALILDREWSTFTPAWRLPEASIVDTGEGAVVCLPRPDYPTIIRVGRGWGRNGRDKYYYYEPPDHTERLVKRPVKRLHEKTWYVCLERRRREERWCFDLVDGRIVALTGPRG